MTEIGPTLREARMRTRVDITEVERATKIRTKYLRAMEDEEWEVLPGPTFSKSFLRTYADYLGLDSRLLVEEFKRRYERPAEAELPPISPPRQAREGRRQERGRGREVLAVVAALAVVLVGLYALGRAASDDDEPSTSTDPPAARPEGERTAGGGAEDGEAARGDGDERAREQRPASAERRARERRQAGPRLARVQIVATGTLYVCLVDGAGRRLLDGVTLTPGSTTRTFRARRLLLTLGNAQAQLRLNGRAVPVTASAGPINYAVTPRGRTTLPGAQAPSCA